MMLQIMGFLQFVAISSALAFHYSFKPSVGLSLALMVIVSAMLSFNLMVFKLQEIENLLFSFVIY
jgi:hypothetical protein